MGGRGGWCCPPILDTPELSKGTSATPPVSRGRTTPPKNSRMLIHGFILPRPVGLIPRSLRHVPPKGKCVHPRTPFPQGSDLVLVCFFVSLVAGCLKKTSMRYDGAFSQKTGSDLNWHFSRSTVMEKIIGPSLFSSDSCLCPCLVPLSTSIM